MNVLITGGLGFIGSHTCVELLNSGYEITIIDNLYNSKRDVIDRIKKITGKDFKCYIGDVCDNIVVNKIFNENKIDAVIHFAGYKAVGESVEKPIEYYSNNLMSTLVLCDVMRNHGCKKFVFSSSATVYGSPKSVPIKEDFDLGPTTNPYGTTKLMIEKILEDIYISDNKWNVALLRYFNPIGAHESGLLGESPNDIPNNLLPYIVKVANKELPFLNVWGNDYPTPDGTGVRDYIHVVDLAKGHVSAIQKLEKETIGVDTYNLGTGKGYSVLDIVNAFSNINGIDVPYEIKERRAGDIATCYADTSKAYNELGWSAEKGIDDMMRDSWNFLKKNS
ncbi:UDP-glucose 4-epimerase [Breznakia sp. PF5-3]|uniref:UDP-glucose 4-epimerase GalE n=1 Tax=unclassified Breznakia TaxID=2623764 RepID=UPI0024065759|nr:MULTISPECIES: UDP-glucose 4-epimerase GalE [unclassified Breznakia]MDF9824976.1 UDP-glucose 4-epimerase [Breznakia sp. PM6-1]MDF9835831.1 UDP-glucose 4-epimerase [Breznakia sp. PF5-3]MDF9836917.1 UDP-glucose 4-epimerase [Breznakia sp. PFB2-8]MDF9859863.1 UDP-glucose 4-epimerase [Breznakia sp. PH5-24]